MYFDVRMSLAEHGNLPFEDQETHFAHCSYMQIYVQTDVLNQKHNILHFCTIRNLQGALQAYIGPPTSVFESNFPDFGQWNGLHYYFTIA